MAEDWKIALMNDQMEIIAKKDKEIAKAKTKTSSPVKPAKKKVHVKLPAISGKAVSKPILKSQKVVIRIPEPTAPPKAKHVFFKEHYVEEKKQFFFK